MIPVKQVENHPALIQRRSCISNIPILLLLTTNLVVGKFANSDHSPSDKIHRVDQVTQAPHFTSPKLEQFE